MSTLGCGNTRDAERAPEAPTGAPTPEANASQPPVSAQCAGICSRALPSGGCETMPTCCPKTVHLQVPPHCPEGYTLDLNSGPQRCSVNHLCVD